MLDCPRCRQPVDKQAIACPYCNATLKAYGHPGITIHRETGEGYLCESCTYHEDDTCTFPQRPYARECTLYRNKMRPTLAQPTYTPGFGGSVRLWVNRNGLLLGLAGLLLISFLLVLFSR
ncbi:zinc ribbon domain-containing protein [Oculatella sp. LEGE 06141]|uniref:zinc ribbon domain-containing protein n=1 Tax=Oculatella sp. LEGE 06141 TaxID=1828648 RepID=UPI00187E1FC9|nr:zinc ribbon domain-containing protein [Oculatella sp. LEGE 06141]MBE9177551.1 zinc ribbon domain-containing protein [Oculatella sp. LEGE 06141]